MCISCSKEHKSHNIIYYEDIILDIEEIKEEIEYLIIILKI